MKGLGGNDTYTVNHTGDKVVEVAAQGTDKVESTISHTLAANVENLQLIGTGTINGTGNELANTIIGNDVAQRHKRRRRAATRSMVGAERTPSSARAATTPSSSRRSTARMATR